MSDSEDEELAVLRRERAQRLGASGMTMSAIRKSLYHGTSKEKEQGLEDVIHDHDDKSSDLRNLKQSSINGEDVPEDPFEVPEELRAQLPISFGGSVRDRWESQKPLMDSSKKIHHEMHSNILMKHEEKENPDDASDEPEIGPRRPPADEEENDEFLDTEENLPITSEALLESHDRAVVSLAWDDSGSRLLSGSNDYNVKIFDFGGMKSDCKPFRSLTPSDGYPVVSLSWSSSSDAFFAVTTSNQPKIYDRDGKEQGELPLGDMYIRDMKNTKGHIAPCRGGAWHPTDKATGLTCSEDGTLRVWDLWTLNQKTVIKPTLARPGRVAVTACNYSSDGKMIAGGLFDGTVQLWDVRGKFGHSAAIGIVPQPKAQAIQKQTWSYVSRSGQLLKGAHEPNNDITCLKFSRIDGGKTLISRGADGTLKLWDIRKFKQPLAVAHNLTSGYQTTECCFSPDEKLILTGIGIEQKGDTGSLAILDRQNLNMIRRLGVRGSAVAVTWHPRLNQIAIGCGDRNEGAISILYDATMSVRGALMALGRRPRKETSSDYRADVAPQIFNPNALPLYRDEWPGKGGKRRHHDKDEARRLKTFKPDKGQARMDVGTGGALGASGGTLLTQYILKNQGKIKKPEEEDIRASILRHAGQEDEYAEFTKAYQATQPKRIYAKPDDDNEEDNDESHTV